MELFNIYLILILIFLNIWGIILYIKLNQLIMIMGLNIMEPKKPAPVVKEKHLRYNPADLFNPYRYGEEEDLDPVVPEINKSMKQRKVNKNEY